MSYSNTIYRILKIIDLAFDQEGPFETNKLFPLEKLKISEKRLEVILKDLIDSNYILGIHFTEFDNGKCIIHCYDPCLTIKGMLFIEENSIMKRAYDTLVEARSWIPGY
ncbi:hypothetical protein DXA30_08050 [Fusobacterium ulcerans]|uniref:YjcQ family protein n=1 Tax=Fusobacterium ulcerans TaxID=861 RepID=UPI000E4F003E|nr:YjcQ family protein [Fusobacterium ulcerans]RGY64511.1 hypothetical protein DXA30_08050 [Fusobacterium ulcerans]